MEPWFNALAIGTVLTPWLLLAAIAIPLWTECLSTERYTTTVTQGLMVFGLICLIGLTALVVSNDTGQQQTFLLLDLVHLPAAHFHLRLEFIFDWLSLPMAFLTWLLCGTISAFATHYMHREPGFQRFFMLFAMFLAGMNTAVMAGSIETLFLGWELVGLSSALLVAFFHERETPVRSGLRVWSVYRLSDAAFLIAAGLLHQMAGEGEFAAWSREGGWPAMEWTVPAGAWVVGLLLVLAAAGKSALIPFSGWLPRAMEGPTPSSAVFYGALSIHLGAYLLLRVSPVLEQMPALSILIVLWGGATAVSAAFIGRVQTDIKSGLAYASLVQVGLIVAEIGLGLKVLALVHIIGHASLRTLQLLRAPSILRDYHELENVVGQTLTNQRTSSETQALAGPWRRRLYRWSLERGHFDAILDRWIVGPFMRMFQAFDRWERTWLKVLSGSPLAKQAEFADQDSKEGQS